MVLVINGLLVINWLLIGCLRLYIFFRNTKLIYHYGDIIIRIRGPVPYTRRSVPMVLLLMLLSVWQDKACHRIYCKRIINTIIINSIDIVYHDENHNYHEFISSDNLYYS